MNATPLVKYQARRSQQTHDRAVQALQELVKKRQPVTFSSVALAAGVSRGYLYRNRELAKLICAERDRKPPLQAVKAQACGSVEATLRAHIRRLEATHEKEIRALREENEDLRRQLQNALGELLAKK
ncbi:DUF6262 family protein [Kytococcus schroeteri]|uniref:DUF6262 family protein n=1 Tax=Kytococcus schroeteri TaxID=138300 RepID=UPI0035ECB17E